MIKDFKAFIMRGNVIDLAVAVIIGAAFIAVVNSLTNDILLQIVAAVVGEPNFSGLTFEINGADIRYGSFFTVLLNFLIVAFVVFLVVKGISHLSKLRRASNEAAAEAEATEIELLTEIRNALVQRGGGTAGPGGAAGSGGPGGSGSGQPTSF